MPSIRTASQRSSIALRQARYLARVNRAVAGGLRSDASRSAAGVQRVSGGLLAEHFINAGLPYGIRQLSTTLHLVALGTLSVQHAVPQEIHSSI